MAEKVCLVTRILHLREEDSDSYAKEILKEQLDRGWEGLTSEVRHICKKVGLPDACQEYVYREEHRNLVLTN